MSLHWARYVLKSGKQHLLKIKASSAVFCADDFKATSIHRLITFEGKNVFFTGDQLAYVEIDIEEIKPEP